MPIQIDQIDQVDNLPPIDVDNTLPTLLQPPPAMEVDYELPAITYTDEVPILTYIDMMKLNRLK